MGETSKCSIVKISRWAGFQCLIQKRRYIKRKKNSYLIPLLTLLPVSSQRKCMSNWDPCSLRQWFILSHANINNILCLTLLEDSFFLCSIGSYLMISKQQSFLLQCGVKTNLKSKFRGKKSRFMNLRLDDKSKQCQSSFNSDILKSV